MSSQPLLPSADRPQVEDRRKRWLTTILVPILLIAGIIFVGIRGERVPKDPVELARYYLKQSPVIDGHIDVPILVREMYANNLASFDLHKETRGHLDIPRIKQGHLGGFFWSIFTDCRETDGDFLTPTDSVRDTLEAVDIALNMIERYSDTFQLATTADEVLAAVKAGKVASLMGVEGAHSLGNSLSVIRLLRKLGVRYLTLTHSCNNAFADSAGIFEPIEEAWGGLSPFGRDLVKELNRLGVLLDLSHVSDKTALQALSLTRAPVILSHSASRHFNNITRNVPDQVLDKIGRGKHQVDGVVMVNFYPAFASDKPAKVDAAFIADHVEYIANRIGKHHVGIGSDYDGIESTPRGLEDVSKYPNLFAELIKRGWTQDDLSLLAGGNVLRILRGAEEVSEKMKKEGKLPSDAVYSKRKDLGLGRG
ncbi:membrane dipeptidase-domain-containing protein [Papiliotrema laurentii]|uniref:Dipeptidase n=1 Tax=Papiliotrema laurentii TaxID=5418 RepID=A0AAD9FXP4_PAPLA|nr:membrane dipeptidase-domain-containing protein [Papiliotrema laurentii]